MPVKNVASKKLALKCYFCGGALQSDDAHFEIFDQEERPFSSDRKDYVRFNEHGGQELYGALAYPGNGNGIWKNYRRVALFAHTGCGPDVGYNFTFDRLDENWDRQLGEKTWYTEGLSEALTVARKAMGIRST